MRLQTAPTALGTPKLTHKVRLQTAPTALGTPKLTHKVRLQTAPTALGTPKLTHKVRLQTAPTALGTPKLTLMGFAALYPTDNLNVDTALVPRFRPLGYRCDHGQITLAEQDLCFIRSFLIWHTVARHGDLAGQIGLIGYNTKLT